MYLQKPTWSPPASDSSKARNHVIVRNRVIEISDEGSDVEITPSPTPALGVAKGPVTMSIEGSTKGIVFHVRGFLY